MVGDDGTSINLEVLGTEAAGRKNGKIGSWFDDFLAEKGYCANVRSKRSTRRA
jgi:hypothetical protein